MPTVSLRSNTRPWKDDKYPSDDHPADFISALFSGGDSRISTDPLTGLNKYLCPSMPAPDLFCASSCTASPVSVPGFDRAAAAFANVVHAPSGRERTAQLAALTDQVEARLLHYFGAGALARVFLCPSGTDAVLLTATLLAAERPGEVMTAILPSTSETGTGVPMAALGRIFDGPASGKSLTGAKATAVEIAIRSADGSPLGEDEVNNAFAVATAAARGNAVVYLTYGSKTGLIAPVSPPDGANVIVDACQARIEPAIVQAYLRRGWPVVMTGSKFFGGPAFSGAVLFPRSRLVALPQAAGLGTVLRWTAALATIDAFEPIAARVAAILSDRGAAIQQAIASSPVLKSVAGMRTHGLGWAGLPSIFTFAVRDPTDSKRLMTATELRSVHARLASAGVLLGQPVNVGKFGGLRIAIGARDLLTEGELLTEDGADGLADAGLTRIFAALEEAISMVHCSGRAG